MSDKPMRIKIRADLEEIYWGRVNMGVEQKWNTHYLERMTELQGEWLEVETKYCFEDQFNTIGTKQDPNGFRITASWVSEIDFGDLGIDGWKKKVTDYYAEAWPGRNKPAFGHVDYIVKRQS